MVFELLSNDRIKEALVGGNCELMRAGRGTSSVNAAPSSRQPDATPATRPANGVCQRMLLDEVGAVRAEAARAAIKARFKDVSAGTVPSSQNLRLDARASACDDPRITATLYDFDTDGVLRAITLVWVRPNGPVPAPICNERAHLLAMWYSRGLSRSPSRLQGQSDMARVVLQDVPERNLVLEAYASPR
jgi:hypothetical protein